MLKYKYNKPKNNNKLIIIIVCIIIIIAFSFIFYKSNNSIIRKVSGYVIKPFEAIYNFGNNLGTNMLAGFSNTKNLTNENSELKNKVKELEYELLNIEVLEKENTSLKNMVGIKEEYKGFDLKYANIIYRDNDNFADFFEIDLGKKDGIKLNQTVVSKEGLVGYISDVTETSSKVVTMLDPTSAVSVTISTINEPAILKGDLKLKASNELKLEYIPIDTMVSIGDFLYTSGLSKKYPANIPVGKIKEIVNDKDDIDRYAIVTPFINIYKIKEVAIIMEN